MRRFLYGLCAALAVAACNTTHTSQPDIEPAIRFGIEACERHLFDGTPFPEALSASARGRAFALETVNVENWYRSDKPYRLMGERVWVGAGKDDASDPDDKPSCHLIAVGGGGPTLRDTLMREHIASTDRKWTDATANARGKKAVCTIDRIATGKSLLMSVRVKDLPGVETVAIRDFRQFLVSLEFDDTCERGYDYWL